MRSFYRRLMKVAFLPALVIAIGCSETVRDIDGNVYRTVKIGDQVWMAENLKTTRYNDGSPIEYPGDDNEAWENNTEGAYAWYFNNTEVKNALGALYNWYAVETGKLCPAGWKVPSDSDWKELERYLGMDPDEIDFPGWRGLEEGGMLKDTIPGYWNAPNMYATNETGFSAFPGDGRDSKGWYNMNIGYYGYWWTSAFARPGEAWCRGLHNNQGGIYRDFYSQKLGFSVRCIKDDD